MNMQRELFVICAIILSHVVISTAMSHYNVGDFYAQRGLQRLGSLTFGNDLGFDSRKNVAYGRRPQTPTRFSLGYPHGGKFVNTNRDRKFPLGNTIMRGYGSLASRRGFSIVQSVLGKSPFQFEY